MATSGLASAGSSQRRGKTMRVSDFVSSSFDRFDQQYNTACNNTNHISSSSSNNNSNNSGGGARGGTSTTLPSTNTNNANHNNNTEGSMEMPQQSFFQSMLIDLLRNTHNDNGATSLPVLFFALCRVIIALISLLLSIVGIVLHVLLAITIRILFVVVDAVGLVQRAMWRLVERAVMIVAIRIDYNHNNHATGTGSRGHHDNNNIDRDSRRYHSNNGSSSNISSTDTYSSSTHSSAEGERKRGGGGGGIIGKIWEAYGKQMLHQLSLITNTRTKLGRLPDIMNNTPPSLSLFALVTAVAFIVHPDGLTWIVLGKLCEGVWMGLQLLRDATATIVAAALSASSSSPSSSLSSSSQQQQGGGSGGGINSSSGGEALPTLVASAVLASLVLLGVVIYKALYKKNMFWGTGSKTGADGQSFTTSGTSTSSSNSKKKKGRRGRNSGRHGNHHHNRGAGQKNNKKDDTVVDSTTETSGAESSSLDNIPSKQPSRSRSLSPSSTTSRSNSLSSFGKETQAIDIPKPNGKANGNEAPIEGSKEKKNFKKESVSGIDSNSNNNSKSSAAQELPPEILSKLRPDSTDSLSVPQLLDEDVSLESSVAGSSVVDCGAKQGGGPSGGGGGNGVSNSNITSKKRGGTRGKHHGGTVSGNGIVRAPPGFVTKDSAASKSSTSSRITTSASSSRGAKHLSSSEKHDGGRNNRQKHISPKRKQRDSNQIHNRGTRTRASTTDCVIRQADLQNDSNYSSPRLGSSNGNSTIGVVSSPTPSILSSGQPVLQHEQLVNLASANESSTPYLLGNQVPQDSSLLNNSMMRKKLNSPISPPVVRPPPGLGFGGVKMNSLGHSGVGNGLVAHSNNAIHGPTLSPPARLQPQRQHYSSYDQSNNFLLQPSVFPSMSMSNNQHKMKETTTNEDDKIDADLQELGDQMVGSVLDF